MTRSLVSRELQTMLKNYGGNVVIEERQNLNHFAQNVCLMDDDNVENTISEHD